ncbi:hypothetical protein GOV13_00700 [Candidatus Pacearchaeota archaeon]|nr:hypothetical protein [Candidatus Pacearchaeota archaeon]
MIKRGKKANILTENIIFIVLNLVFLVILILFLFSRMSDVSFIEEKYAKQIALMIDSAKPEMEISLEMSGAIEQAKKKGWVGKKIVDIRDNVVTVKLHEEGGNSYAFFNDVDLDVLYFYPDKDEFKFKVVGYK